MSNVKGSVLLSRLDFVREHFGEEGVASLLEALTDEDRGVTTRLLPAQWYPFELGERIDDAIMTVLGRGDPGTFHRLGVRSAEVNLAGVHAVFVHVGDPHGLLRRAPAIYKLYYDTGSRSYEKTGEHSCRLTTRDSEGYSRADCFTVIGWHQRAVELCGGRNVRIEHPDCRVEGARTCQYDISWNIPTEG